MPNWRVKIAYALCLTVLLGAAGGGCRREDIRELCIMQTTDIHGYIEVSDLVPDNGGGWLRLATLISDIRRQYGAENTLLIDCGDTIQGTFMATLSQGQVASDMLTFLQYDAWVPGNHELDFGVPRLVEICDQQQARVLCGNLTLHPGAAERERTFPAWRMHERNGVRIAVIGLTARYLDAWFWGDTAGQYAVVPAKTVLEQIMPQILTQTPDMIVLAIHQGWMRNDPRQVNEVVAIAEEFPEIDLILGGHTHWEHAGRRIGDNTWYVQAGRHADMVAKIIVTVDRQKHAILDVSSQLLTATADIPWHAEAVTAIKHWLTKTRQEATTVVGELATAIDARGRPGIDCATSELIATAIAQRTNADVVIHGRLSDASLPAGAITEKQLFDLVPYENNVGILRLTPEQLQEVVAEQLAARNSYVACGVWGIEVTVDNEWRPLNITLPNGTPVTTPLRVAFNSYTLASGGGRFPKLGEIAKSQKVEPLDTGLNTRDIIRGYLKAHPRLELPVRQWIFVRR